MAVCCRLAFLRLAIVFNYDGNQNDEKKQSPKEMLLKPLFSGNRTISLENGSVIKWVSVKKYRCLFILTGTMLWWLMVNSLVNFLLAFYFCEFFILDHFRPIFALNIGWINAVSCSPAPLNAICKHMYAPGRHCKMEHFIKRTEVPILWHTICTIKRCARARSPVSNQKKKAKQTISLNSLSQKYLYFCFNAHLQLGKTQ